MRTIPSLILKTAFLVGIICYAQTAPLARGEETYAIVKGDSVASICQKFQLSIEQLSAANPSLNPSRLVIGQQIKIPTESKNAAVGNDLIPIWPGVNSSVFKAALDYGIAQTLYSTFDFNNWSSISDSKIPQTVHQKLGKSIKVDIFAIKDNDDNSIRISVFFPDFSIGNRKLVLLFIYNITNCFLVESKFDEELSKYDFSETNVDFEFPHNYRTIVKAAFQLKTEDIAQVKRWCQETLKSDYPTQANETNHFFVAPYNKKYDQRPVSLYWVEGKKVVQIEHLSNPDGTEGFVPKEMSDFSEPIQAEKASDYANSYEWRNFTVARHIIDGLLLTVNPVKDRATSE